ncbi:MAG: hypothetical protein J6B85_00555 [Lachnospiraceae bacterium]|nr:hypothetical protein [Lachnospiraceae bacterium]
MMRKSMKAFAVSALALGLGLSLFAGIPALADTVEKNTVETTTTGTTKKIKIKEVSIDLEDNDDSNVDIDFTYDIKWQKTASVTVTDETGRTYSAEFAERDEDDCEIYVDGLDYGHTYTFTISGVRRKNTSSYGSVSFSVEIPKASDVASSDVAVAVKKAEYDLDDKELDIEFRKDVVFQEDAVVTVTDADGNLYSSRFIDKGDDECEIRVRGLTRGETYYYTITGIRNASDTTFGYASGSFTALDD